MSQLGSDGEQTPWWEWLRRPWLRWLPAVLWMVLIFSVSAQPRLPHVPEPGLDFLLKKLAHFTEYGILAILLWWAIHPKRWSFLIAWGLTALYAASDEWHQSFVPGRNPSLRDVLIDSAGAATALLLLRWWVRRQEETPPTGDSRSQKPASTRK